MFGGLVSETVTQKKKKNHLMCSIASSLLKTLRRANGKRWREAN